MPTFRILKEVSPGKFTRTKQTFEGSMDDVQTHIEALRAKDGHCYAAEAEAPKD
ncbi:MAG: hypothetical protein AB7P16_28720 [Bradyrhizobium sp.]|uniref:hypothetical protein n=1 Tax=Bradyrhizobium sp. TaxID=376 RepID=UPI003D141AAE